MNWQARLSARRAEKIEKGPGDPLPKLTEPGFVGFVSDPDGHSENIAADATPDAIRAHLLALAEQNGIDSAHVHAQDDDDLRACRDLSDDILRDWLRWQDYWRCKPMPRPTAAIATRGARP